MKRLIFLIALFLSSSILHPQSSENTVLCDQGPITESYCYGNGDNTVFNYISSDGTQLNLTIDSGLIEAGWDLIISASAACFPASGKPWCTEAGQRKGHRSRNPRKRGISKHTKTHTPNTPKTYPKHTQNNQKSYPT